MSARIHPDETACLRAIAAPACGAQDAGPECGLKGARCAFEELTAEAVRAGDARDAAELDAAERQVEAGEAEARGRLRAFEARMAVARRVFVATGAGPSGSRCEAWSVRQDPGSPSGWLWREYPVSGAVRERVEVRFAAHVDSVELTGWISTFLPSSTEVVAASDRGGLCSRSVALLDVSAGRVKLSDQTWFLTAAACEAESGAPDANPSRFGPTCRGFGR